MPLSVLQLTHLVREECGADVPLRFRRYAEAYPGRRDVFARSPDPARLTAAIGPVDWPDVRSIVREVVAAERAGVAC